MQHDGTVVDPSASQRGLDPAPLGSDSRGHCRGHGRGTLLFFLPMTSYPDGPRNSIHLRNNDRRDAGVVLTPSSTLKFIFTEKALATFYTVAKTFRLAA